MEETFGFFKITHIPQEDGSKKGVVEIYFPAKREDYERYERKDYGISAHTTPKFIVARYVGEPEVRNIRPNRNNRLSFIPENVFNEEFEKYEKSIESDIDDTLNVDGVSLSKDDKATLDKIFKDYGLEEK